MDLSEFEENPDMRITVWVNELMKGVDRDRLEVRLSVVTGHLQTRIDELCDALDGCMAKLVHGIPRAKDEVERLEVSLETLASELAALEDVADEGHTDNDTAHELVEILCRLDTVKERINDCITILREAKEWDVLVRDIRSRLSEGDLAGVVEKLVVLDKSRQPLEDMPGACERAETINELKSELEKQLLPCVRAAMEKSMSSIAGGEASTYVPLSELVSMYERLGQTDVLCSEYAKARTQPLHQLWYSYASQPPENALNETQLPRWLLGFYNKIGMLLAEEYKCAGMVFGTNRAASVFLSFISETMKPIEASLAGLLRKIPWPDAVELQSGALSAAGSALVVAQGLSQSERIKLLQCFSSPFDKLAQEFGTIEFDFLKSELHSELITLKSQMDNTDEIPEALFISPEKMFVPRLREIVAAARKALQDADKALLHCLTLTSGLRSAELLDILSKILGEVMNLAKTATEQSRLICGPLRGNSCSTPSDGGWGGVFDWVFLSTALEYLSCSGGVQRSLTELEQSLAQNLGEAGSAILDFPPQALEVVLTPTEESCSNNVLDNLHRALGFVRLAQGGDELHSMLNSAMDTLGAAEFLGEVLPLPVKYMESFVASARQLVYDISMVVVLDSMNGVANLQDWGAELGIGGVDAIDESYGVPHAFMTVTGEHLLSLLQQLEPFARSSNFADVALAIEKGGTTKLPIPQWKEFGKALGFSDEDLVVGLGDVASGAAFTLVTSSNNSSDGGSEEVEVDIEDKNGSEEEEDELERNVLNFCRDWMLAIGGGTVGMFLCEIAKVKKFSSRGAAQLVTDCAYLGNVLNALDIQPHPLLLWMESVVNQHLKMGMGQQPKTDNDSPFKLIKGRNGGTGTPILVSTLIAKLNEQIHAALP